MEEDQFEAGMDRWTRVLEEGRDEDGMDFLSASIPRGLLIGTLRDGRDGGKTPSLSTALPMGVSFLLRRFFTLPTMTACTWTTPPFQIG